MKRRTKVAIAVGVPVLTVAACAALAPHRPGIVVVVRNESGRTVTRAVVETTGREFPVGDIPDGEEREVGITSLGESSAIFGYTVEGHRSEEVLVGYFEGGPDGVSMYGGRVEFTIGISTRTTEGEVTTALPFLPSRRPLPAGRPAPR